MTKSMILVVNNLSISVTLEKQEKFILRDTSLAVRQGEMTALVGGSGSGKTTLGLAVMNLLAPALKIKSGEIILEGKNILPLAEAQWPHIRGRKVGMIFQEPLNAFNPVFTIGSQIEEVLCFHSSLRSVERKERVLDLLRQVEILDPARIAGQYPHQLSGGLRQRAMIAQAIAASPQLIIADEPTSNLDVTIQAKIMELFRKLCTDLKLTLLLITHDLGMVKHLAQQVYVLNTGQVVEHGPVAQVMGAPRHEYTGRLLQAALV